MGVALKMLGGAYNQCWGSADRCPSLAVLTTTLHHLQAEFCTLFSLGGFASSTNLGPSREILCLLTPPRDPPNSGVEVFAA